jgi:hypothetical protein
MAAALGPASGQLLQEVKGSVSRKNDTLQGFDPRIERRFGYTRSAVHRLEAGEFTLSGKYVVRDLQQDHTGTGNMLALDYTWRSPSRGDAESPTWWGLTLQGADFISYSKGVDFPGERVFLKHTQAGVGILWGGRFSRGAWWTGANVTVTDIHYDNPTHDIGFKESPFSVGARLGAEVALLAARSGPDVDGSLAGTLGRNAQSSGEGERRHGFSVFVDGEFADWGTVEGDYLRYWRAKAGLRYYPSAYFAIGVYVPFYWAAMREDVDLEWRVGDRSFRMSVLVQF